MFKNFVNFENIFSQNIREPVARLSYDVPVSVANLAPQNFGEFTVQQFQDTRTNVMRKMRDLMTSGEKIKLNDFSNCRGSENETKLYL